MDLKAEKARIYPLAAKLFGRLGYEHVSLDDISKIAKADKATLSKLAFSKEDLFFQVLQREVLTLVDTATETFAANGAVVPDTLIRRVAHDAFALAEERPLVRSLMMGRFDDKLPAWRDRLHELRLRCLAVPERVLRAGMEQGLLRQDLPLELTAQLLFELHAMGYLYVAAGARGNDRAEERRRISVELILRGVKHPSLPNAPLPMPANRLGAPRAAVDPPAKSIPEIVRDRFLDAAYRLAAQHGADAFNLESTVAASGGIPPPAGIHSSEDLLFALLERDVAAIVAAAGASIKGIPNPMAQFGAMSEAAFEEIQKRPLVMSLVNGAAAETLRGRDAQLSELFQRMANSIVPMLELGISQKLFRDDLPLELLARVLFELHMAGHLLHYRPGSDLKLRALQRRVAALDLVYRGISAPGT